MDRGILRRTPSQVRHGHFAQRGRPPHASDLRLLQVDGNRHVWNHWGTFKSDPALELDGYLAAIVVCTFGCCGGRDLVQACRDYFSPRVNFLLWVLCEIAIAACDLAEIVGSASALQLLFALPWWLRYDFCHHKIQEGFYFGRKVAIAWIYQVNISTGKRPLVKQTYKSSGLYVF